MRAGARRRNRASRAARSTGGVMLIAMPWQILQLPSIQLGTLQPLLEQAGIRTDVRSFKLDFMEHCRVASQRRIGLSDYEAVAADHYWVGLGEWIFAVPPFSDGGEDDAAYLEYLRRQRVPERDIGNALAMRKQVPAFLEACVADVLSAGPRIVGFTSTFSQTVPSLVLAKMLKGKRSRRWCSATGASTSRPSTISSTCATCATFCRRSGIGATT